MPQLKRLSAGDVIQVLSTFEFQVVSQRGSHVKMQRYAEGGRKETLTIPNHKELARGTAHAIFKQASAYIPKSDLEPHFYTE